MTKTVQLGLRIENELLERIKELADNEGIDRNVWIKRALALFVADEEDGMSDQAIEDYICLRIDEQELKAELGLKEISKDIKEARQMRLNKILEAKDGRNIRK